MKAFRYTIALLDPLFYSQDGLGVAKAPPYLHATAVNGAIAAALGLHPEQQPYVTRNDADEKGEQRNVPQYENSWLSPEFYFSPARPKGQVEYVPEIVKGDGDGAIQGVGTKRYPKGEILRASKLLFIAPETEFEGYALAFGDIELPELIRLGSFRGKARLRLLAASVFGKASDRRVEHPVDPLVSPTHRGFLINMFPYPLVEDAYCPEVLRVRLPGERFDRHVGWPADAAWEETAATITEHALIV